MGKLASSMTTENSEAIESAFSQLQTHIKFLSDPAGYVDDKYLIPWVEGALGNKSAGQLFLIFDKAYKDEFGSKSVFISGRVREGFLTQIGNKLADMLVDAVLAGLDSAPAAKRLEQYCRHVEFSSGSLGKNSNVIADIRGRLDTALKKKPDQLEIVRAKKFDDQEFHCRANLA